MLKKIVFGKSQLNELHQVFDISENELENKKVRLFPSGNTDTEIHTTSIFLSTLCAVKEYREEVFTSIGIKKITNNNVQIHAFTEVANLTKSDRTDALIVITTGKHSPIIEWAAFIEAKVGKNNIEQNQIDNYIGFAQEIGITNIITISNQLVTKPTDSPVITKKRSFKLYHWSWPYLKVTAGRLINSNSVSDIDHIYILKELRRYFDNHKKLTNFINMGAKWKESVDCIRAGTENDDHIENICNAVVQEEKDNSLQLTDNSGLHVELFSKGNRKEAIANSLKKNKKVSVDYCINRDKRNLFSVEIDFELREIKCSTKLEIKQGKAKAQTSRLIKILSKDSGIPDDIIISGIYPRNKSVSGKLISLSDLILEKEKERPYSIIDSSLGDEIKFFEIKVIGDLTGPTFQSSKKFIYELESYSLLFINQVMKEVLN